MKEIGVREYEIGGCVGQEAMLRKAGEQEERQPTHER